MRDGAGGKYVVICWKKTQQKLVCFQIKVFTFSGVASPTVFGGQNVWLQASNSIVVRDVASQSAKWLDMQNLGKHGPLGPPGYAYVWFVVWVIDQWNSSSMPLNVKHSMPTCWEIRLNCVDRLSSSVVTVALRDLSFSDAV